jgi:hypothetical protein
MSNISKCTDSHGSISPQTHRAETDILPLHRTITYECPLTFPGRPSARSATGQLHLHATRPQPASRFSERLSGRLQSFQFQRHFLRLQPQALIHLSKHSAKPSACTLPHCATPTAPWSQSSTSGSKSFVQGSWSLRCKCDPSPGENRLKRVGKPEWTRQLAEIYGRRGIPYFLDRGFGFRSRRQLLGKRDVQEEWSTCTTIDFKN